ncbi:MAG: hypothetical protein JW798_10640 [Prolixibacteraceae bacterium]|nr:hypothetical protein [Prolixibacteraceae bacterium]
MKNSKIIYWTGIIGLIGTLLFFFEIPLWILPGTPPPFSHELAYADHLAGIRIIALTRILIDLFMYMCLMVFFAGFRHLIKISDERYEWAATLSFGAAIVWWAVSLVADGLEGAAVLNTVGGTGNPTIVRAMVEATLLIYNGSIAFAVTALFMGVAGFVIVSTGAIPKWIGWLAWVSFALCMISIPAMYGTPVDVNGFYNAAGWGPTIVANVPPLIWFFAASIAMIIKSKKIND